MAAKTRPLGIRYSPRSLLIAIPAAVIIVLAAEPVVAGVWQFMTALPKGLTAAIILTGLLAIGTASLSDNCSDSTNKATKIASFLLLLLEGTLFVYGVFYYYPTAPPQNVASKSEPVPSAIHVSVDGGLDFSGINRRNQISRIVVISNGSNGSLTPVDMLDFITIANRQDIPLKVERLWWKDKDWELCPVSILGGRLYWLGVKKGTTDIALPIDLNNSLEQALTANAIPPHQSVSGWSLRECPIDWCSDGTSFGVEDAEGHTFTVSPELKHEQTHALGTIPSFFTVEGDAPVPMSQFGRVKIQRCR